MSPLVSIIVPVYNAENYLDFCIQSILNQTYKNIEIILIDDGSSDRSLQICRTYQETNPRIIVLSGANRGVSHARNRGLDTSSGDWIAFVDSDDCISKYFVEYLLETAEYNPSVIPASSLIRFSQDHEFQTTEKETQKKISSIKPTKMPAANAVFLAPNEKFFRSCLYNKLYHRSLLSNSDEELRFAESIYYGEDQLFFYSMLVNSSFLAYTEWPLYFYRNNPMSAMNQSWNPRWNTVLDAYRQIWKLVQPYDNGRNFPPYIAYQDTCISLFLRNAKVGTLPADIRKEMQNIVSQRFADYLLSPDVSIKRKIYALGFLTVPDFTAKYNRFLHMSKKKKEYK